MKTSFTPNRTLSFDDLPPDTLALDGAVSGGPRIDNELRRYNFDHHEGCLRFCTTATCQQVLDAMLLGLDPSDMTVLVNDIDGDTVLSLWLLRHADRWKKKDLVAKVQPLVISVGQGDSHGPVYHTLAPALASHFHVVIMEPLRIHRKETGNATPDEAVLNACVTRLELWWHEGLIPSPQKETELVFPKITEHGSWVFADAGEPNHTRRVAGAAWLYEQGYDRLVLASSLGGGKYKYALAKRSDFVTGFPLNVLFDALNKAESEARDDDVDAHQTWGGASTVGGSPREGSFLTNHKVIEVVSSTLKNQKETPSLHY